MADIFVLAHYRNEPAKQQAPNEPRYFCMVCDSDIFKMYATRSIHCACCGSRIRDLFVKETS